MVRFTEIVLICRVGGMDFWCLFFEKDDPNLAMTFFSWIFSDTVRNFHDVSFEGRSGRRHFKR
jgi:hypothetical protein